MKLIKGKNASRGFTLVELIVVMGLSLMVLTLMVTMLTIFTAKVDQNKAYHGFYDEVAMCRDEIQKALSTHDVQNKTFEIRKVSAGDAHYGKINVRGKDIKDKDVTYTIDLYGSEFSYPNYNYNSTITTQSAVVKVYLKFIDRIELTIFDGGDGNSANNRIIKCKFVGHYGKKGNETEFSQTMLFSLESYNAKFEYKD